MFDSQNLLAGKRKYLLSLILLLFIASICVAFSMGGDSDFDIAKREVLLRGIGHELLLQAGDSTSRVLPVKKITKNEYQVSFENELTFQSGPLVNTISHLLASDPFATDYIVSVLKCGTSGVAYGYEIAGNKRDDQIPCIGRKQPKGCYIIDIKFKPADKNIAKKGFIWGSLPILAFIGFAFFRSFKPKEELPNVQNTSIFTLGGVLFDAANRKLIINRKQIDITGTETRVLLIFAQSPNKTIERNRLQKEIWEDEGVIVGRSLDMFISKLRKKLDVDPHVKIINVRGKGYKLEVGA
jgi:DNA-binding winged helix-turn-helix (wHTH) protein